MTGHWPISRGQDSPHGIETVDGDGYWAKRPTPHCGGLSLEEVISCSLFSSRIGKVGHFDREHGVDYDKDGNVKRSS
jgi:hypothetical protein